MDNPETQGNFGHKNSVLTQMLGKSKQLTFLIRHRHVIQIIKSGESHVGNINVNGKTYIAILEMNISFVMMIVEFCCDEQLSVA
jgi:hypothetical protein